MSFRDEREILEAAGGDVGADVVDLNSMMNLREELIGKSHPTNPEVFKTHLNGLLTTLPSRESYLLGNFMMSALYVSMQNRDLVETARMAGFAPEVTSQFSEEFSEFCTKNIELIRQKDFINFGLKLKEYIKEKNLFGNGLVLLGITLSNFFNGFPINGRRGKST